MVPRDTIELSTGEIFSALLYRLSYRGALNLTDEKEIIKN